MEKSKSNLKMDKNQKLGLLVVAIAIFTDMLVYSIVVPILPQYAAELGASQQVIGLMFASYALAFLAATPVIGMISDRFGRKKPMIIGLAGLLASTLLFAFANDITILVIARALQGISAAATWTAGLALLADLFPASYRQQAMGLALSGSFAGMLLGPGIGGFLYEYGGYMLPFLAVAGLVLLDGLARIFLLEDPPVVVNTEKPSITRLLKSPTFVLLAGVITLMSVVLSMLEPTLPLHLLNLGISNGMIGVLFTVMALASVVVSPVSYMVTEKFGRKRTIVAGLILAALLLPFVALAGSFLAELAIMALIGAVLAIGLSSVPTEMTDISDRMGTGGYGAVFSVYNIAMSAGMMIGPVAGGMLAGYLGLTAGMMVGGLGILGYAALIAISLRGRPGKTSAMPPVA
jgi:multidrug resistance protein